MLVNVPVEQNHMPMKSPLCGILVATQLMGVWLAGAQTNIHRTTEQKPSAIQAKPSRAVAVSTGRANPIIAVFPRSLDFGSVTIGRTSILTFTVQNMGSGILAGAAKVSAPFSIVGGSPYTIGSSQSQGITVQYLPKATGLNMTVVLLTGGGGASLTVAGSAVAARPARPAAPSNLRLLAGR